MYLYFCSRRGLEGKGAVYGTMEMRGMRGIDFGGGWMGRKDTGVEGRRKEGV